MHRPLSLKRCYTLAWRSFAKWWIPLCLLAGTLMITEWMPKNLAHAESSALIQSLRQTMASVADGDLIHAETQLIELNGMMEAYVRKLAMFTLYAAPFVALLGVFLICASLMAVKNRRKSYSMKHVVGVSLFHMCVAFGKVLLLFLFLPLGIYVYVKLYFASLLMLEEEHAPVNAIKESWSMTHGHFWSLFGMNAINGCLLLAMAPTVIGIVPATGFANTARSAAFTLLRENRPAS